MVVNTVPNLFIETTKLIFPKCIALSIEKDATIPTKLITKIQKPPSFKPFLSAWCHHILIKLLNKINKNKYPKINKIKLRLPPKKKPKSKARGYYVYIKSRGKWVKAYSKPLKKETARRFWKIRY